MNQEKQYKLENIKTIASGADSRLMHLSSYPEQGDFVIAMSWRFHPIDKAVGYVCQIRKGCGQFGSDMYLIRHYDGCLQAWENESFIGMHPGHVRMCRRMFEMLPEDEEFEKIPEYRCPQKIPERGYIIENSKTKPSPDVPFAITVFK